MPARNNPLKLSDPKAPKMEERCCSAGSQHQKQGCANRGLCTARAPGKHGPGWQNRVEICPKENVRAEENTLTFKHYFFSYEMWYEQQLTVIICFKSSSIRKQILLPSTQLSSPYTYVIPVKLIILFIESKMFLCIGKCT